MRDIFDEIYNKKIYILGVSEKEREILSGVYNVNKTMYLITHGDKYQVSASGLRDMDHSPLEIIVEKVDDFSVPEDAKYFICHCDWKTGIPLTLDVMRNDNMYLPRNDMVDEMLREFLDEHKMQLKTLSSYKIVATDVFILSFSPRGELGEYGYLHLEEDALTECIKDDLEKTLKIGKDKDIKLITDPLSL